jgi:small subunit ribosomal protein S8
MSMTDPIADMLTRIRNGAMASHDSVVVPASKLKVELARVFKEEGYIADYEVKEEGKFKVIVISLKYDSNNKPVITKLVRVSKPGLKTYSKAKNLQKVLGGLGVAVVSTSKGLMTDRKARKENIGGEVLCYVY